MRFGYVLLGVVTLMSFNSSSGQQCSNGLAGVQSGDVCCDADCGTCGGSGCGSRPGGSSACCRGVIEGSGVLCSTSNAAPCIIDDEQQCSNGFAGVQNGDVCCDADCGTCGGSGCGGRPGGPSACCSGAIEGSGVLCSTSNAAPCIIDDGQTCSNGLAGVQNGYVCCEAGCGTCGGSGCASRPGGSSACCSGVIEGSGVLCSTSNAAPCIIDDVPTDACNPNPCLNGGLCATCPYGGHTCSCVGEFGGLSCQIDTSSLAEFFIEVYFDGPWTNEHRDIFQWAADRWSRVVTHVPCGGTADYPAGRLLINATLAEIDDVGNTLGFAGPHRVWLDCPSISLTGKMTFDIQDINALKAAGLLEGVILHQMGHVIGVGTLWKECSTCFINFSPDWTCPAALTTYADIGGVGANIVEVDLAVGSNCANLDEAIFYDELMTPIIDNPMFLSKMTAATLEDIGYIVDSSMVDEYILPAKRESDAKPEPSMVIIDTAVETTIGGVDSDGNVFEEIYGFKIVF